MKKKTLYEATQELADACRALFIEVCRVCGVIWIVDKLQRLLLLLFTGTWEKPHPTNPPVNPGRCKCKHAHEVAEILFFEYCPLVDGHTMFSLYRCFDCGKVSGFPDSNLDLALQKGTEDAKTMLNEIIWLNRIPPKR